MQVARPLPAIARLCFIAIVVTGVDGVDGKVRHIAAFGACASLFE
jgi:hypothetical protein